MLDTFTESSIKKELNLVTGRGSTDKLTQDLVSDFQN